MSKNSTNPFVRKIIYIACIGGLMIPLSMVSRPEIRDGASEIKDAGGMLSQLRDEHNLSQAKISEVDPASETMKLASLGLRGIAVNILWMQAIDHKKKEDYDKLASTLKSLTKIQPNFVKVWEFQAHNLAYNVSMEFDDYEYRYQWVTKGLDFLKGGIPYNRTDHRVTDNMGFMTGNKFGKSDEKKPFRRIFRKDNDFHQSMSDLIDPDAYDTRTYGHDSWKMAWHWYDRSRRLVEEQSNQQYKSDLMFKMYRPAQTRNQAQTLAEEYKTDEIIQEIWGRASEEWMTYGESQLTNSRGVTYTLERMEQYEKQLILLREKLDALTPGIRESKIVEQYDRIGIDGDERKLLEMPSDQLTDAQAARVAGMRRAINTTDKQLDFRVAADAPADDRMTAKRIAADILKVLNQMAATSDNGSTIQYTFWKNRNKAESQDFAVRARQAIFEAEEMMKRSIYDDEFELDYKTKERKITRKGANSLYLEAFSKWKAVFTEFPELRDSPLADNLLAKMQKYGELLQISGREWPEDFPLQDLIDDNSISDEAKGLPTTKDLEEYRQDKAEIEVDDESETENAESVSGETENTETEDTEAETTGEDADSEPTASSDESSDQ